MDRKDDDRRAPAPDAATATRRAFLQYAGIALGGALVPESLSACGDAGELGTSGIADPTQLVEGALTVDSSATVLRSADLLSLRFDFINLVCTDGVNLKKARAGEKSFIVVTFPPQHIVEPTVAAYSATTPIEPAVPLDARISGPTRLVFQAEAGGLANFLEQLLKSISQLPLNLPANAAPPPYAVRADSPVGPGITSWPALLQAHRADRATRRWAGDFNGAAVPRNAGPPAPLPTGVITAPSESETAIELPYRIVLAPHAFSAFAHAVKPYVPDGARRVELWSTRLGIRGETRADAIDERGNGFNTVRAVWSPDVATPVIDPFVMVPSSAQRAAIARQSSDFGGLRDLNAQATTPTPVHVKRLMLTSLGGTLDAHGDFAEAGGAFALEDWKHEVRIGRNHQVRVVEKGFLSTGHAASRVTVTERRFSAPAGSTVTARTAFLYRRSYIVVREALRTYDDLRAFPLVARVFPFRSIELTTTRTPDLDDPTAAWPNGGWPYVGGKPFRFACVATDLDGNVLRFDAAAFWFPWAADLSAVASSVGGDMFNGARISETPMRSQRIALAESLKPGDTSAEVTSLTFGLVNGTAFVRTMTLPPWFPFVERASLALPAVRQLTGAADTKAFTWVPEYVTGGFGGAANPGNLFMALASAGESIAVGFSDASDRSGGFLTPNMFVKALSRDTGLVAGDPAAALSTAAAGAMNPAQYFGNLTSARLFGVIKLSDIIAPGALKDAAPKFVTEALDEVESFFGVLDRLAQARDALEAEAQRCIATQQRDVAGVVNAANAVESAALTVLADFKAAPDGLKDLGAHLATLVTAARALAAALHLNRQTAGALRLAESIARAIETSLDAALGALASIPAFVAEAQDFFATLNRARNLTTRIEWRPDLQASTDGIFAPRDPAHPQILLLAVEARAKQVGTRKAGVDLTCSLDNFSINLVGPQPYMTLDFRRVRFDMQAGKKPDVDVVFDGITFQNDLSFLNVLKDIVPLDGFSDPPYLDVDITGIKAGFSLGLPNIAIGIFSLENIAVSAWVQIPFLGPSPTVGFSFCTRENPFRLSVSFLGGGGFFAMTFGMDGLEVLEAALEFGACVSMSLVVASGSVSVMAGIYLRLTGDSVKLSGYVRIRGQMEVLGLVSVSVEMRLEIGYQSPGKAYGIAEITLEISIAFFSKSVGVTCEKTFCANNADPTFAAVMAPEGAYRPWDEYSMAFA